MRDLIYAEECYKIVGACFEVYNHKGHGFLEPVYQECMEIELSLQGIPSLAQVALPLTYKGVPLKQNYRPDFVCFGKVILELKAVEKLADEHLAQVLNYLNATGYELGVLINFGSHPKLDYRRIVRTPR
jgi:GxxExxY protein